MTPDKNGSFTTNGSIGGTPQKNGSVNGSVLPPPGAIPTAGIDRGVYYSTDTLATSHSGQRYLIPEDVDDGKQHFGEDENKERGNWSGKLDFLLSCLGYAVGLGNVWRFPYLCYRNGGGAFFIPYVIMLLFVGVPLFFFELSLGQFASNGPLTCWQFAPLFKGCGVAQLVVSAMVAIYYNMIIAWALFYLFSSFTGTLPWSTCDNDWNTPVCAQLIPDVDCEGDNTYIMYENGTCYDTFSDTFVGLWNYSVFQNQTGLVRVTASEEYYNNRALSLSSGIDEMGPPKWDLTLCLVGAWFIAFFCMIKGIKSSGKVVYFTALFPYVVLFILFFRGVTLPNAGEGIYFYMVPKWERLLDAKVWNDAAVQIFFSLSNCWGGLIALSSYNRFHNNTLRDTIIVSIGNCSTSIFAGFVIFSFLGFMAGELNTTVEEVVDSGPGLAFIVYPDAVTRLPVSPLWAILFFLMLITLGLDSQFAMLETVLTSALDQFSWLRPYKTRVICGMCLTFFILGLSLCTHGGAYMLQLMDTYCGGWSILVIGLTECIAVAWVYGVPRYFNDIRIMTGSMPSMWWRICWQFISPALIVFILLFSWIDYSPARYGSYTFPVWADVLGWFMSIASVIWIPVIAIYKLCREDGPFLERLRDLTLPTREWGPALVKHRRLVDYVPGFIVDPWETGTRNEKQGQENFAMTYPISTLPQIQMTMSKSASQGSMSGVGMNASQGSISFLGAANSVDGSRSNISFGAQSHVSYESGV